MAQTEGSPKNLSEEEVQQRVALLKRFRELLSAQRKRFNEYLEVLDRQKDVIEKGDADALVEHVELEEKLVADIFSIQKVVEPLDLMYREFGKSDSMKDQSTDIPLLKNSLEDLKTEVAKRAQRNKGLLSSHLEQLRKEIKGLRANPFNQKKSVFADTDSSSYIDIQG